MIIHHPFGWSVISQVATKEHLHICVALLPRPSSTTGGLHSAHIRGTWHHNAASQRVSCPARAGWWQIGLKQVQTGWFGSEVEFLLLKNYCHFSWDLNPIILIPSPGKWTHIFAHRGALVQEGFATVAGQPWKTREDMVGLLWVRLWKNVKVLFVRHFCAYVHIAIYLHSCTYLYYIISKIIYYKYSMCMRFFCVCVCAIMSVKMWKHWKTLRTFENKQITDLSPQVWNHSFQGLWRIVDLRGIRGLQGLQTSAGPALIILSLLPLPCQIRIASNNFMTYWTSCSGSKF